MLSTPHQKFCEGLITGATQADAYAAAFPRATRASCNSRASRLIRKPHIQEELARMRRQAEEMAGAALLTHLEIRGFLARIVRATSGAPDEDRDLGKKFLADGTDVGVSTRDKLLALKLEMQLSPPPEPEKLAELEAFYDIIRRVRSKPWRPGEIGQGSTGSANSGSPTATPPSAVVYTTSASGTPAPAPQTQGTTERAVNTSPATNAPVQPDAHTRAQEVHGVPPPFTTRGDAPPGHPGSAPPAFHAWTPKPPPRRRCTIGPMVVGKHTYPH